MKKQVFALAAIGIVASGMLYSCTKDKAAVPGTAGQQASSVKRAGISHMEQFVNNFTEYVKKTKDCGVNKGTCIGGVIIEAPKPKIFNEVLTVGNPASTGKFFADANNYQYIPSVVLNNPKLMVFLSSGKAYSKLSESALNKEVYLIGESADLNLDNSIILPVTIQE